jgi:hypothetical protein
MMLAGVPVPVEAVAELASTVRATGADQLADRLDQALGDGVPLLALTIDERAIILATLEDPPEGLAELRGCSSVSTSGRRLDLLIYRAEQRLISRNAQRCGLGVIGAIHFPPRSIWTGEEEERLAKLHRSALSAISSGYPPSLLIATDRTYRVSRRGAQEGGTGLVGHLLRRVPTLN